MAKKRARAILQLNPKHNLEAVYKDGVYCEFYVTPEGRRITVADTLHSIEYASYDAAVKDFGKNLVVKALEGKPQEVTVEVEEGCRIISKPKSPFA